LIGLNAVKLEGIAKGWLPSPKDLSIWREVRVFTTASEGMTVNCYLVWDEVSRALRANGIDVREDFGSVKSFEKTAAGVRMMFSKNGQTNSAEAAVVLVAVGWVANTRELNLAAPGVALDARGFVKVDAYQRTTAPHVYAAGDVTGRYMLVMQAIHGGIAAATNAVSLRENFDIQPQRTGAYQPGALLKLSTSSCSRCFALPIIDTPSPTRIVSKSSASSCWTLRRRRAGSSITRSRPANSSSAAPISSLSSREAQS